jgi:hypothetical protein
MGGAKVHLVTNPMGDSDFRSAAERLFAQGADTPTRLQNALRDEYPSSTVFGGIEEAGLERWYVYREGRWVDSSSNS